MDTINHATQGFLSHYLIGSLFNPIFALAFGFMGAIIAAAPDLIGEIKARFFNDGYEWYDRAHKGDFNKIMKWIPAWGIHTWLDSLSHDVGERWYVGKWYDYFFIWKWKEMMWLEVLTWIINITILILIFLR